MSVELLEEIRRVARSSAVQTCWRQWGALGAMVTDKRARPATAVVDLEALLLLSLSTLAYERRLEDTIAWWATTGAELTSVQRISTIAKRFPDQTRDRIGFFATLAAQTGDRRWKRYIDEEAQFSRRLKGPPRPILTEPPSLMIRLRAGMGVGVKSDLLAFLLGLQGKGAPVRLISKAIGYTEPALYTAARDMARARFIQDSDETPVHYFVYADRWSTLLQSDSGLHSQGMEAVWRYPLQLFSFLSWTMEWSADPMFAERAPYVLSSEARDLYEKHRDAFDLNGIQAADPESYQGVSYLEGFLRTLGSAADWMEAKF